MNPIGGTTQNQNTFAPYNTYRDCSLGICSIYCHQWCNPIFPPPPPFTLDDDTSHSKDFFPLFVAVTSILAITFMLVCYYIIVSKHRSRSGSRMSLEFNENRDEANPEASWQATSAGLDEAIIRSISVFKYKKVDGFVQGTDCSVCLSEFQENDSLRLLPICNHAFHVCCIDTWFKSHSNCPLCRANIASNNLLANPNPDQIQENSRIANAAVLEEHQSNDHHVLVVHDLGDGLRQEAVLVVAEDGSKRECVQEREARIEIGQETGIRSGSVGSSIYDPSQECIADKLSIYEEEEDMQLQIANGLTTS